VKLQGDCGSCWIFAGIAIIESKIAIQNRKRRKNPKDGERRFEDAHVDSLSEQPLVDCMNGCGGGLAEKAVDWTVKHGLIRFL